MLDAVDENLIGMYDERNLLYGKLHLVLNTSQLQGEPHHNKLCHQLIKDNDYHT